MRSSILLLAVAATGIAATISDTDPSLKGCAQPTEAAKCLTPAEDQVNSCTSGPEDAKVGCACKVLQVQSDCYTKYCPSVAFPGASTLSSSACAAFIPAPTNSKSAGDMLFVPAGGLLSAVIAVLAWL